MIKSKSSNTSESARDYLNNQFVEPTIGEIIQSFRECEDMTQAEFARQMGVSRQYIHDVEKGKKLPALSFAIKASEVLGFEDYTFVSALLNEQLKQNGIKGRVQIVEAS